MRNFYIDYFMNLRNFFQRTEKIEKIGKKNFLAIMIEYR